MAMGADYSFELIFNETCAPQFNGHNNSFLASVSCVHLPKVCQKASAMEILTVHNFFNQSQNIYEILNERLSALRGRKYFISDAFYIIHLIMYGKNLADKCKNYLKIPMTGLFAWHVSIHYFGRYQFHQ